MSSILEELKHKLKTGSAKAELKITTGGGASGNASSSPSKWLWPLIVGIVALSLVVAAIVLCVNHQREKMENLNVVSLERKKKEEEPLIEVLDDLEGAQKAIEEKAPADPNFTLLEDLR
jgi:hypothetical protein